MGTPRNNSVIRAFSILCGFDQQYSEMTIAEIAKRTKINHATAHRFLLTLEEVGAVVRNTNGNYQLGMLVVDLGGRALQGNALSKITQPYIDPLVEKFRETVHVAILSGNLVCYIGKGESQRSLKINTHIGKCLVAYCSGLGKVLLAGLSEKAFQNYLQQVDFKQFAPRTIVSADALRIEIDKTRQQGFGIDDEETEEGLRCIAVPIYNNDNRVTAAVSISGPTTRLDWKNTSVYIKNLRDAADALSKKAYPIIHNQTPDVKCVS